MGLPKDFFRQHFGKLNIHHKRENMSIEVNFESFGRKLDYAQDKLDAQVWNDIQLYMPGSDNSDIRTMTNTLNMTSRGEVYLYPPTSQLPYGHYLYEGKLYIDPETGSPYARSGVTKVDSGYYLNYPSNERAEAHWDEIAYQNHHRDWIRTAKRAVK